MINFSMKQDEQLGLTTLETRRLRDDVIEVLTIRQDDIGEDIFSQVALLSQRGRTCFMCVSS